MRPRTGTRPPQPMMRLLGVMTLALPGLANAQSAGPTGFEVGAVPAINFDSDEGFGYGVVVEVYHYGEGGLEPYQWTLQPTIVLSTEGRRDFTLFFDTPHLLPGGWRLDAFLGSERQIASPYYGVGNATVYDEALASLFQKVKTTLAPRYGTYLDQIEQSLAVAPRPARSSPASRWPL